MKENTKVPFWGRLLFGGSGRTDIPELLLRLFFGCAFISHGWPKMAGGSAFWLKLGKTMGKFGITWAPEFWGFMAAFAEFGGGILLLLGLFTRFSSFLISFTMFIAAFGAHGGQGFKAMELALVYLVCGILFLLKGSGKISLDYLISKSFWGKTSVGKSPLPNGE